MLGRDLCVVMGRSGGTSPSMTNNILTASEFCAKLEVVMEGMGKKWVLVEYRQKKQEGARARGNTGIRILVDVGNIISCGSSFQIV